MKKIIGWILLIATFISILTVLAFVSKSWGIVFAAVAITMIIVGLITIAITLIID